jgi:hypothetical protein
VYLCVYDLFLLLNQGILSTESGQRALMSFDSYERSLIEASILFLLYLFFLILLFQVIKCYKIFLAIW